MPMNPVNVERAEFSTKDLLHECEETARSLSPDDPTRQLLLMCVAAISQLCVRLVQYEPPDDQPHSEDWGSVTQ